MKQGNTFAAVAFSSYGLFWFSLVGIIIMPEIIPGIGAADSTSMSVYLSMWGLFTGWMFLSTLKMNRGLQVVFGTLTILFFLLAVGEHNVTVWTIAGYEGIICGFSAIYVALAEVTNEIHGKVIFPLGPVE